MKRFLILLLILLVFNPLMAQKYITENSKITFFSEAPVEDIDAINTNSTSIFDSDNGEIVFSVPIKEFQFKRSLMQEHFNEKYLESDKFPKSTFQGKIEGYEKKNGKQNATATGELTIHGVTKKVNISGEMEFKGGKIYMTTSFIVKLVDYDIKIPSLLFQNIAEEIEVKAELNYKEYGK